MPVNNRIPNNFKDYSDKNPNFPKKILDLLNEFLKTADRPELDDDQRISLYDQFLDKYVDDPNILEWSEQKNE
jgi:hypothetical protein|tara:strand:- start:405 stop:623 length:219 start_codon:yes stop_codon:yes gene_type:complete